MPKVKMLKTADGSDVDAKGISLPVRSYVAGHEYDLGASLASAFVKDLGVAEIVEHKMLAKEPLENKSLGGAPENKAMASDEAKPKARGKRKKA